MRASAVTLCGAILSTGLLAGCGDPMSPAQEGSNAVRPGFTRSSGIGRTTYTYLEVKKNGHTKLYRMKINKGSRSIELETVAEEESYSTSSVGSTCDDPTMPGCESNPEDPGTGMSIITGELDVEGTVTDTVETGQQWDPSYSYAGWDGTAFHCASRINGMHFHWKNHYFETEGDSYYIGRIPSSVAGVVKGRYLLPQGPWLSTDGRARIWSGTVDANCYFMYDTVAGIILVEAGWVVVYKFNGDYEEFSSGGSFASNQSGQYGGQVYYSLAQLQMSDPEAYGVLKAWLDTGVCTDGWVIVIDGQRVC